MHDTGSRITMGITFRSTVSIFHKYEASTRPNVPPAGNEQALVALLRIMWNRGPGARLQK